MPRLVASIALIFILAPFGIIFAVNGHSCCASMNGGTCPMRQRSRDACRSPLTSCHAGANENAAQAVLDFQLRALERPLARSAGISLVPPSAATAVVDLSSAASRAAAVPPELPPPREERSL